MGLKRDNHFLSRMYLNAWKNEKGKVNVAELLVPSKNVPYWKEKYISSSQRRHFARLQAPAAG